MKKLFGVLLSLFLITGCFSVCAQQPDSETVTGISKDMQREIYNDIYTALKNVEDSVDLSKYNIPYDIETKSSLALDILNDVLACNPDVYFFQDVLYDYIPRNGKSFICNIYFPVDDPEYDLEKQTKKLNFCNSEINKIIAGIPKNSNDIQKVVYVHDYLVANYGYDMENQNIFDAYRFFKEKVGVCQAYTHAFKMIMDKLGIECYAAKNTPESGEEDEQHIWNVVKIEGCYYHVDCTSDDPVIYDSDSDDYYLANTVKNYVSHENLLVSSEQLIKNDGGSTQHAGLKIIPSFMDIECNSDRFDNAAYREITSPIFNYNGNWYAVTCDLPRKIVEFDSDNDNLDFSNYKVFAESESGDNYCYKGTDEPVTSLLEIGTNVGAYVYFNDPQYVYKYNFLTNKFSKVEVLSRKEDFNDDKPYCYAQGCYISSDGKLEVFVTYDFVTEDDEEYYFTDYDNEYFQCYCDDFQLGDLANNDGIVTANDLIKLKEYILTGQSDVVNFHGLADLTRNNCVDLLDFVKMKQIIAQ